MKEVIMRDFEITFYGPDGSFKRWTQAMTLGQAIAFGNHLIGEVYGPQGVADRFHVEAV
jgi:hypothetical protein